MHRVWVYKTDFGCLVGTGWAPSLRGRIGTGWAPSPMPSRAQAVAPRPRATRQLRDVVGAQHELLPSPSLAVRCWPKVEEETDMRTHASASRVRNSGDKYVFSHAELELSELLPHCVACHVNKSGKNL